MRPSRAAVNAAEVLHPSGDVGHPDIAALEAAMLLSL